MTQYYSIRKDRQHSEQLSIDTLARAVRDIFGPKDFGGAEIYVEAHDERLWLVPVLADGHGNYCTDGSPPPMLVNLIDVRRAMTMRDDDALATLLRPLCVRLGWELVNQDDQILVDARRVER